MNNSDNWQAFLDGSATDADRAAVQSDPEAMREVGAWEAFALAIRQAGQSEAVPHKALRAQLLATVRPAPSVRRLRMLWAIPAIACALAGAYIFTRKPVVVVPATLRWVQSGELKQRVVTTADEAAKWVQAQTGIAAPAVKLWDNTIPYRVHAGAKWGRYDLLVCDKLYTVTFTTIAQDIPKTNRINLTPHIPAYSVQSSIVWRRDDLFIQVQGPTPDLRVRIAKTIAILLGPGTTNQCKNSSSHLNRSV